MSYMSDAAAPSQPLFIDLGKVKRKRVRELKEGRGPLVAEVQQAVEAVRRDLGPEAEGKELLPVVVLYQRKPRKPKGFFGL
jgi:hypothetical protein